jgi:hypothetical protein
MNRMKAGFVVAVLSAVAGTSLGCRTMAYAGGGERPPS